MNIQDEGASGNDFGAVSAIDAFSRVGDELECPPQHVHDLLVGEPPSPSTKSAARRQASGAADAFAALTAGSARAAEHFG
ncbi:hypothetical protein [Streptomyces sp. NPDC004267]|uniref:hypothetical protein n=1 Tax=Streptomyces sp. NPDC004267 TaxID=3364694 RepID=UPI003683DB0A